MAILMDPTQTPSVGGFNRLFNGQQPSGPAPFLPPADVIVSDEQVTIQMDVPGMRAEDLEIELENDTLSVRGERAWPYGEEQQGVWRRIERGFGRFERGLRTPHGLDPDQIQASLADGVLTLSIPRPQPPQPRRVQISAGGQPQTVETRATEQQEPTAAS